ncbi:MAG TPA: aspartate aminotransferase family protein [Bacteroidales bacterium]|jgi:acetylornithine/succinyldiaminopimelate/putrescine aminotransferase|nr:aspartate aminotransferase family protein [Bacteroidales bacterium]HOU97708.1 aspartate aminotransferase family protein [Bacteroidales bacterium]
MQIPLRPLFFNHVAQTSDSPLAFQVSKAQGIYLFDENDTPYIDCIAGISVGNVGYSHPKVVKAIQKQSELYLHTMVYGEHIQSPQVLLAQKLASFTQNKLDSVYFVNSGAEAIEGAIKLARRYTGRKQIVACRNAYHGSTTGAMSLMSSSTYQKTYGPFIEDVAFIDFNHIESLPVITEKTAAVIVEIVQGEAGYIPANKDFLLALKEQCKKTGALLVFDEIQSGMGRTGKMFAFEHFNIIPDLLLLAKALGGGLPLGAILAPKNIMSVFAHNPMLGHMTTFGGNPLCCAASLASIEVLESENVMASIAEKELLFKNLLQHPKIKEVRGIGLMIAIQLDDFNHVLKVIERAFKKHLLLDWFLFNETSIRIAPPLIINNEQIKEVCEIIREAL